MIHHEGDLPRHVSEKSFAKGKITRYEQPSGSTSVGLTEINSSYGDILISYRRSEEAKTLHITNVYAKKGSHRALILEVNSSQEVHDLFLFMHPDTGEDVGSGCGDNLDLVLAMELGVVDKNTKKALCKSWIEGSVVRYVLDALASRV